MDHPLMERKLARVDDAIDRTVEYLLDIQNDDGHWCAELEGDSLLQSEFILLQAFLHGAPLDPQSHRDVAGAADTILKQQEPSGGWALFPGGDLDISASVKAYFALKLAGHATETPPMVRAREAIRGAGGADKINSFTRFFLALFGQIPYELCPAVAPEMMLMPSWSPVNIYRMSAWSRTILVPLSVVWAHRPIRELPEGVGLDELFLKPPQQWPPLRRPGTEPAGLLSWESAFRLADRSLKFLERWRLTPARRAALSSAERWMLKRFQRSDGLGAIYPPILWSRIALQCLGYDEASDEVAECDRQMQQLILEDDRGLRLQPCKSPVWDTANALRALAATGVRGDNPSVAKAVQWLLDREVTVKGDWAHRVDAAAAGWFFEYENAFYPDVDDTIMVMMALRELQADESTCENAAAVAEACERGRRWVLALQNSDGGWGAFDKNNDAAFLCEAPFADHNAMIDPSTPDIAARVVEAMASCSMNRADLPVNKAVRYIIESQEPDGSWYGRWGVNYIYGTWQALVGLSAIGLPPVHPALAAGRQWLLDHQHVGGGWGESCKSYEPGGAHGVGEPTPSQTAWALLGLLATGPADDPAVLAGIDYLLRELEESPEGESWSEEQFTGTGFPLVFYLKYHMYPVYFPLLALGKWRQMTTE